VVDRHLDRILDNEVPPMQAETAASLDSGSGLRLRLIQDVLASCELDTASRPTANGT